MDIFQIRSMYPRCPRDEAWGWWIYSYFKLWRACGSHSGRPFQAKSQRVALCSALGGHTSPSSGGSCVLHISVPALPLVGESTSSSTSSFLWELSAWSASLLILQSVSTEGFGFHTRGHTVLPSLDYEGPVGVSAEIEQSGSSQIFFHLKAEFWSIVSVHQIFFVWLLNGCWLHCHLLTTVNIAVTKWLSNMPSNFWLNVRHCEFSLNDWCNCVPRRILDVFSGLNNN